jgi:hypothetical protein
MRSFAQDQQCEECGTRLYQAGDTVPAGTYLRVDDGSFHSLSLSSADPLPASFDGHVAQYRAAAAPCMCQRQRTEAERAIQLAPTHTRSAATTSTHSADI